MFSVQKVHLQKELEEEEVVTNEAGCSAIDLLTCWEHPSHMLLHLCVFPKVPKVSFTFCQKNVWPMPTFFAILLELPFSELYKDL